jgi:hypothetical protein
MMAVRDVGRSALDHWLKVARFPFDAAAHLLPGDSRRSDSALLFVDRADATVRATIGALFRDEALVDDAGRRRAALEERVRATEIRIAARQAQQVADQRLADGLDAATRLRVKAGVEARQEAQRKDTERVTRERRAQQDAATQDRATEQAKQKRLAAADRKAKQERLKVLDERAKALDEQADALTATDEAQRLRDAASHVKAARKGSA